ncbi:MAG: hypothetical protein EOP23_04845 [Hyphomicrobiales bacterium]|nr:MAG: hypothetical protein EOP23_04845 [Hyphomicrobiales bacterium]
MPLSAFKAMIVTSLAFGWAGLVPARAEGWGSSYNMGTLAVGVATPEQARLTFYCGDGAAARGNPVIKGGPYMEVSLPKAAGLDEATSLTLLIDGKGTAIPVAAKPDVENVSLSWEPGRSFSRAQMKAVVARLAKAKTLAVSVGGNTVPLPVEGAAKALADDPLGCK